MATTIKNEKLFCTNCGGGFTLKYPIEIGIMTKQLQAFDDLHRHCPATYTEPKVDASQYPQYLKVQFGNTRVDLLNEIKAGMKITVSVQLKGKETNGNYFNNLDAFKIEINK